MNTRAKISIVVVLLVVITVTLAIKQRAGATAGRCGVSPSCPHCLGKEATTHPAGQAATSTADPLELPRLLDFGSDSCVPCRKMAPILVELKKELAGRMEVEFIDVLKNPDAGELYDVLMIPTQIFYDASGKELLRHQGFFSREDILAKWKELGVDLGGKPAAAKGGEAK
jgi:thioredoxin 1